MRTKNKEVDVVLITGGAGFVGSNLCKRLLKDGHNVVAVDNLITGRRRNIEPLLQDEKFSFIEGCITAPSFLEKIAPYTIKAIYHLACPTGVPNIARLGEEMLMTNSIGTLNVLILTRKHNAQLLFTSTAEVYGDPKVTPQCETYTGNVDPVGPRSAYEEGKRFSESLITTHTKKYNLNARIVRIFNTYGPGMSSEDKRVIPQFLNAIASGGELRIYGDGSQTRTHLFVDDLIDGLLTAMEKGSVGEVYNIGGNTPVTIKELAKTILKVARRENGIVYEPHFIEDHTSRLPLTQKIEALGWRRTVNLESGLRIMLEKKELQEV